MESNRAIYLRLTLWDGVQLVTGATVPLSVRRLSDGQWWNGAAWQAGYIAVNMTEETGNDGVEGSYIYTAIGVQPRDHYVARARYTFAGDANATPFEAEWQTSHEPVTLFTGTVVSATSSSVTLDTGAPAVADYLVGAYVDIIEGTGAGQGGRLVSVYTSGRVATVSPAWVTTPDATSKYKVRPSPPGPATTVILGAVVTSKDPGNRLAAPITLEIFESEAKDFTFTIQDTDGNPVDLSGMTLRLLVHDNNDPPNAVFKVEAPDIVVSGDDDEVVTVSVSAAKSTDIARDLYFELWDVDSDAVLSHGPFITRPAEKDV